MSNNKTGFLVCAGATCKCQFGSSPALFKVLTQNKKYINDAHGAHKLVATHKELGQPFEPPFFGACSKMKKRPCTVSVSEWLDYYDGVKIESNGGMPLLHGSKATCVIGAPGCISIAWHGQTAHPTSSQATNADTGIHSQINPLVNPQGQSKDANEAQRAKAIRILKQCPKCSCGDIMLGPVESLYKVGGEFQSGKIGDHYEQVVDNLKQPATLDRLREIAERETEFWRSKDGTTFGALMPAVVRYQILKREFLASGCSGGATGRW